MCETMFVRFIFNPTPPAGRDAGMERRVNRLRRTLRLPHAEEEWHYRRRLPLVRRPPGRFVSEDKPVDFCRGPAEIAAAIQERRPCRLFAELGLHITELIEALQYPQRFGGTKILETTFPAMEPLPLG